MCTRFTDFLESDDLPSLIGIILSTTWTRELAASTNDIDIYKYDKSC